MYEDLRLMYVCLDCLDVIGFGEDIWEEEWKEVGKREGKGE